MKENNSFQEKIIKKISNHILLIFIVFVLIVIIIPRFLLNSSFLGYIPANTDIEELSNIVNNLTTPIIGLFSAFLIYLAFRAQIDANEQQKIDLVSQQEYNLIFESYKDIIKQYENFQIKILNDEFKSTHAIFKLSDYIKIKGNVNTIDYAYLHALTVEITMLNFNMTILLERMHNNNFLNNSIKYFIYSNLKTYKTPFSVLRKAIENVPGTENEINDNTQTTLKLLHLGLLETEKTFNKYDFKES